MDKHLGGVSKGGDPKTQTSKQTNKILQNLPYTIYTIVIGFLCLLVLTIVIKILFCRQYWNYTIVIGFFCLLVLNSVPIGAVAVMTSEKQVCVLLALSSPLVGAGYETTLNQISDD